MRTLLEKCRLIGKMIQKAAGKPVDFEDMARVLSDNIECNCYIVGRRGKLLGYHFMQDFNCSIMEEIVIQSERFPESYNEGLLRMNETVANVSQPSNACVFSVEEGCEFCGKISTIVPIFGGGVRVGTLVLAKFNKEFNDADLVLAEYGGNVVGMEIMRLKAEKAEEIARKKAAVQIAVGTLSYSELE
ncbi:MAG: GTP-sensing pleiotropic transcriptional regulator CodY, partial [Peptococcaceae bacterium]|nr:GTP-sensing pleiotropic transcriptional regulator CodY [Peptococcaceae bacterium]